MIANRIYLLLLALTRYLFAKWLPNTLLGQLSLVTDESLKQRVLETVNIPAPTAVGPTTMATRLKNLAAVYQAGVPIITGTDAGNPLTLHGI